jgi:hypothetical protein
MALLGTFSHSPAVHLPRTVRTRLSRSENLKRQWIFAGLRRSHAKDARGKLRRALVVTHFEISVAFQFEILDEIGSVTAKSVAVMISSTNAVNANPVLLVLSQWARNPGCE